MAGVEFSPATRGGGERSGRFERASFGAHRILLFFISQAVDVRERELAK